MERVEATWAKPVTQSNPTSFSPWRLISRGCTPFPVVAISCVVGFSQKPREGGDENFSNAIFGSLGCGSTKTPLLSLSPKVGCWGGSNFLPQK